VEKSCNRSLTSIPTSSASSLFSSSLSSPFPELPLRRLALGVFLSRVRYSPPHIRVGVESRTAWVHLALARRPRIPNRSFSLLVSFQTFAHRICCTFQWGQFLKACSHV